MIILVISLAAALLIILVYFISDYYGPKIIHTYSDNLFGIKCLKAAELIIQETDNNGNIWASRGMIIYKKNKEDSKFVRIVHIPTSFSYTWLNNFKIFRRFILKTECIEFVVIENKFLCILSAGYIWHYDLIRKKTKKTYKLEYYGIGIGRGIMSSGLLKTKDNLLFFGEYFRNDEKNPVRIYKSIDYGLNWEIVYEFKSGEIRHIHALQVDPFTDKLWICTGDSDDESMIGWSDDNFKTIIPIGRGSQIWRVCQLVFTQDAIYWGTDTGSGNVSGIYCWNKKNMEITNLQKVDGAVFFGTRLTNGTVVFSTDREGFPNEKDDKTRLFIINKNNTIASIPVGTWNHKKPGLRYNYAKLRFQRNQGNESLIISCLNQKEVSEGMLLIIFENALNSFQE